MLFVRAISMLLVKVPFGLPSMFLQDHSSTTSLLDIPGEAKLLTVVYVVQQWLSHSVYGFSLEDQLLEVYHVFMQI